MAKTNPCKVCGGPAKIVNSAPTFFRACCKNCSALAQYATTKAAAIRKWNAVNPKPAEKTEAPAAPMSAELAVSDARLIEIRLGAGPSVDECAWMVNEIDRLRDRACDVLARASGFDDKPHQLWNGLRLLAELLGEADYAKEMDERYNKPKSGDEP